MNYKNTVGQIAGLPWRDLSSSQLVHLMVLSTFAAREFGESLRLAIELYPDHKGLKIMAAGELQTSNLSYDSYKRPGDHADFLLHFLWEGDTLPHTPESIRIAGLAYHQQVRLLSPELRAMSVFSREAELTTIFTQILTCPNWTFMKLGAFRYYLEQHITLDSMEGGHSDLLSDLKVTDEVDTFYKLRLQMYKPIFPELIN